MEDDLNFKVNGRQPQFTSPASPELGTAQPQLVIQLLPLDKFIAHANDPA